MYSPDGRQIVTASWDRTAIVWDAESGQKIRTLVGHTDVVHSATFSPDGLRIVTASRDKTAIVWDAESGQRIRGSAGHTGAVLSASHSPDRRRIVTSSDDKTAIIWDAESGERIRVLAGQGGAVDSATFSPDGRRIVTASGDFFLVAMTPAEEQSDRTIVVDMNLSVWDAETGEIYVLTGHSSAVNSAAYSPDGRRIVSASWDC